MVAGHEVVRGAGASRPPARLRSFGMLRRLLAVVALALVAALGGSALLRGGGGDPGVAVVARVVDGDTIVLRGGERVRYIGMDTPESVKPGTPVQCYAKAAGRENRRLVAGRRVRLRYDVEHRDRYGRTLAYVYRAPDGLFVNAELVRRGYARVLTIPPNVEHASLFRRLAARARAADRGLWASC
jgi:micrococcal nuclease